MPKYSVLVPIAGAIYVEVEADSIDEAEDKAFEADWSINFSSNDGAELHELEPYSKLVEGNVCRTYYTQIDAEEIEE